MLSPLRQRVALVALVVAAVVLTVWALVSFGGQQRVSSDASDVRQAVPTTDGTSLEAHIVWVMGVLNGDPVSADDVTSRLTPEFLAELPAERVLADLELIAAEGPYLMRGVRYEEPGLVEVTMATEQDDVGVVVLGESPDFDGRLELLLIVGAGRDRGPFNGFEFSVHLLAGWALLGVAVTSLLGVFATHRHLSVLLGLAGLVWLGQLLELADNRYLYTTGLVAGPVAAALGGLALYSAAKGATSPLVDRSMAALLFATAVVSLSPLLFIDPGVWGLPAQLLAVDHNAARANVALGVSAVVVLLVIGVLAALVVHSRRVERGRRWSAAAVLATLAPVGVVAGRWFFSDGFDLSQSPVVSSAVLLFALGLAAVAIRGRSELDLVAMVTDIGRAPAGTQMQDSLARALDDPSVQLLVWSDQGRAYLAPDGSPVALEDAAHRSVTQFDSADQPVGAVLHDPALAVSPDRARVAMATAGMALDNHRLTALVQAQLADVRASRARLVQSAEQAQRRVERNLHDGAQQRLLALLLSVQAERTRLPRHAGEESCDGVFLDGVANELSDTIEELRELGRGLHPSALDHGLGPALVSLAERSPLPVVVEVVEGRFAEATEAAAFFVVQEAVTNATRHAQADHVRVCVDSDNRTLSVEVSDDGVGGATRSAGRGLQSLEDRVLALGGHFTVTSPTGGGTRVQVKLPLGEPGD